MAHVATTYWVTKSLSVEPTYNGCCVYLTITEDDGENSQEVTVYGEESIVALRDALTKAIDFLKAQVAADKE